VLILPPRRVAQSATALRQIREATVWHAERCRARSTRSVIGSSLLSLVPAFAVLIGFICLGEVPIACELLGGVVMIAGVALVVSLGDRILAGVRRAGVAPLAHARPAR